MCLMILHSPVQRRTRFYPEPATPNVSTCTMPPRTFSSRCKGNVLGLIIGQDLKLALAGAALGAVGALMFARMLSSLSQLLYGVRANDPVNFCHRLDCTDRLRWLVTFPHDRRPNWISLA
jgi:hypothetical protein